MFPTLQVGPLSLQAAGLILISGIWISLSISEKYAQRFGVLPDHLYKTVLVALGAGLLGARLIFAIFNLPSFVANPLAVFTLSVQMLDLDGGLLFAILAGWIYLLFKKIPIWPFLDALSPGLAVFAITLALANLASGDGFGAPTRVPWGIFLWGEIRHPSQIYELIACMGITILLWPRQSAAITFSARQEVSGTHFLTFIIFQAAARLFLESFRGDSIFIVSVVRLGQVADWLVLAASLVLFNYRMKTLSRPETA